MSVVVTNWSRKLHSLAICALAMWCSLSCASQLPAPSNGKQRLVVLTDIGAEVDDSESMVRLLLYSDAIDIQGLIATTSVWKRTSTSPELIRDVIAAYAKVHSNLLQHDPAFPTAPTLDALVKHGPAVYGMAGVGQGKDSEGSAWIIHCLEQPDERPLWVAVWGGANTLAQALYTLRATRSPAELDRLIARLRVYTISDQDDSGPWIRKTFPKLFYIVSPGGQYSAATWTGINNVIPGLNNTTVSNPWLADHIQQGHGPLGAVYPDVAYCMEGDTPSWLGLVPNGLDAPEHPDWGGWGGRYELYTPVIAVNDPKTFVAGVPIAPETRPIWTNAVDAFRPIVAREYGKAAVLSDTTFRDFKATIYRWRDDFQNDFAARMAWTTKPFAQANHPPVPWLDTPDRMTVHSAQPIILSAHATDPDGDSVSFFWFQYAEAGTYKELVDFGSTAQNMPRLQFVAPTVDRPATLHIILRVTDKGAPPLSAYKRIVITVLP